VTALEQARQAVADCLRARDAIRALPNIKPGPIALQGTSLGGFVAATVGGIEPSFDPVVLLISGGDGYGTLMNGLHDAMHLRQALEREGYRGDALRTLLEPVEPLRVAHRLNPQRTWLISARDDVTIPKANSDALAEAVGLDDEHHIWLNATHYTAAVLLPAVTQYMADIILDDAPEHPVDFGGNGDGSPTDKPLPASPPE
jgi:dienelactone hydrolase